MPPNCVTSFWSCFIIMNRWTSKSTLRLELNIFHFYATHTDFNQTACHPNETINLQHPCLPFEFGMDRFDYPFAMFQLNPRTSQRPRFQAYHRKPPCGRERPRAETWGKCVLEPGTWVTSNQNRGHLGSGYTLHIYHPLTVNWTLYHILYL